MNQEPEDKKPDPEAPKPEYPPLTEDELNPSLWC